MTWLLKSMLTRTYDLELLRATCSKVRSGSLRSMLPCEARRATGC